MTKEELQKRIWNLMAQVMADEIESVVAIKLIMDAIDEYKQS